VFGVTVTMAMRARSTCTFVAAQKLDKCGDCIETWSALYRLSLRRLQRQN
jgi:hypothetical protein